MDLYESIDKLDRVVAIARVSSTAMPTFISTGHVLNEKVVVFPVDGTEDLAVLCSRFHIEWAWEYSGTRTGDLQYAPSDCFDTLPRPNSIGRRERAGHELHVARQAVMEQEQVGLTALYGRLNDTEERATGIARLRQAHIEVDEAVREAYALDEEREPAVPAFEARVASEPFPSWREIELGHGFHKTR